MSQRACDERRSPAGFRATPAQLHRKKQAKAFNTKFQTPSETKQTNLQRDTSVRLFVCHLSVMDEARCFIEI